MARGEGKQYESMAGFTDVKAEFHKSLCSALGVLHFHLQVSKATLRVYLYKGHQGGLENVLSTHPSGLRTGEALPLTWTSSLAI